MVREADASFTEQEFQNFASVTLSRSDPLLATYPPAYCMECLLVRELPPAMSPSACVDRRLVQSRALEGAARGQDGRCCGAIISRNTIDERQNRAV